MSGFTGISFPFRVGVKGGIVMSTTSSVEAQHIIESIEQILMTSKNERGMEFDFCSDLNTEVFEPNDQSTYTLIEYQVKEALKDLEDRIEVKKVDITSDGEGGIFANITFKVIAFDTTQTTSIKVGDFNVKNSNR